MANTAQIGTTMEDKNKQLEPQNPEPRVGSGSLLATARKQQNRSVEEIADELNLSVTQIKTIELDQTEGLPEPTYVRGYIRSYAKLLGLNAEEILKSYLHPNWQKGSSLDDIPRGIATAEDDAKSGFSLTKVIIVLVLLASIAFLWKSGLLADLFRAKHGGELTQTQVVTGSDLVSTGAVENSPSFIEAPSTDVGTAEQATDVNQTLNEVVESELAAQAVVVNDDLTLTFDETCWVDIRDSNDNRIAYKSYAAGDTLTVTNKDKLHVFLGNAEGVNATYQGQPFDLLSYREGVYAKFSLVKEQ